MHSLVEITPIISAKLKNTGILLTALGPFPPCFRGTFMTLFDVIDLEPLPAVARSPSGQATPAPALFHADGDNLLISATTDSEVARAFLYHAELAPTTLKSTKTELGRFYSGAAQTAIPCTRCASRI
jgi:hypothetical protein